MPTKLSLAEIIFVEDQLQRRNEDDSIIKENLEIIPIYIENNLENEDSDSSEIVPEHERTSTNRV